jgi:uncharacterized protein (DUF433 family)
MKPLVRYTAPIQHIIIEDDTPLVKNGRVKVRMIAQKHFTAGETIDAIAAHYGLSLSDVYAALAYYCDNQAAFDALDSHNERIGQPYRDESAQHQADIDQRLHQLRQQETHDEL